MGSNTTLSNDDRTVSSTAGDKAYALTTVGGWTSGKAHWELKLVEDTDSQCSCFGLAMKPVQDSNYERSKDLWMYRAYNGYVGGLVGKVNGRYWVWH